MLFLRYLQQADQAVRNGGTSAGLCGREIRSKKVGIIGCGQIGFMTAKLFQAFGAEVYAYARHEREEVKAAGIAYKPLDDLLRECDIISLHTPNNKETRGMISAEKIALMKKSAIFINCARGPIVDSKALAQALNEGRIAEVEPLTGKIHAELNHVAIFPASHYVVSQEKIKAACDNIEEEMKERVQFFKGEDKLIEAQRIAERTNFDIEMLRETGFCSGIENYSRHLNGLPAGAPPMTLLDFFPDDFLIIVDESHMTIPQIRGMYAGDRSRKQTLVDYGFRLPSALDNRPLNFEEFEAHIDQMMFVSATPSDYEKEHELLRTEQIIRPTGLLDPEVQVRPVEGQIDDLIGEVNKEIAQHHKVLITTLTKRMAEDLTDYMKEVGIRVKYLHSDIDTLERAQIIRDMRLDVFDVLVGINLLREGLDIPEITLVAILDADKEGFLRSATSLIQTIGRAARNAEGHVIMYADTITDSMREALDETNRRREIQMKYNEEHGITPQTIKKAVRDLISISKVIAKEEVRFEKDPESMTKKELEKLIGEIQKKMQKAAADLNFEAAAELRDKMLELKKQLNDME